MPNEKRGLFGRLSAAWEKGQQNQQQVIAADEQRLATERARAAQMFTFFSWATTHAQQLPIPAGELHLADFKNYLLSEDGMRQWTIEQLEKSLLIATYERAGKQQQVKIALASTPATMNNGVDGAHYWVLSQLLRPNGEWAPMVVFHFTDSQRRDIVAPEKIAHWQQLGKCWAREQFNALNSSEGQQSYTRFAQAHRPIIALAGVEGK